MIHVLLKITRISVILDYWENNKTQPKYAAVIQILGQFLNLEWVYSWKFSSFS